MGVQLYESIGKDIEPAQMSIAEHIVIRTRVASDLASISVDESQSNLWSVNATYKALPNSFASLIFDLGPKSLHYWIFNRAIRRTLEPVPDFFVAGLPAGTTTGVLRQHLMRLNSSIPCEEIDSGAFPSSCPGDRPFTMSWPRVIDTDVRICVPGNYTASPWTLSRSRQDHIEEMCIDIKDTSISPGLSLNSVNPPQNTSYTIRCTAKTTRGYFELGNDWNNNTYGSLLDRWPNTVQMVENFNDWSDTDQGGYIPSEVWVR